MAVLVFCPGDTTPICHYNDFGTVHDRLRKTGGNKEYNWRMELC
jgi:hypothetical protein